MDFCRLCRARDLLREVHDHPLTIDEVAREAAMSPFHFIRQFNAVFGTTPHQYRIHARLDRARQLLALGTHSVTDVCMEVGFSSLGSFSALFAYRVGLSPSEYRRYARSSISVPATVRPLFVPSCFLAMLYGPADNRNFREARKTPPIVSSSQSSQTGR